MIVSYRDARTTAFAAGKRVKALSGIDRSARLKLDRLESATTLNDLAALPGNRLEGSSDLLHRRPPPPRRVAPRQRSAVALRGQPPREGAGDRRADALAPG